MSIITQSENNLFTLSGENSKFLKKYATLLISYHIILLVIKNIQMSTLITEKIVKYFPMKKQLYTYHLPVIKLIHMHNNWICLLHIQKD